MSFLKKQEVLDILGPDRVLGKREVISAWASYPDLEKSLHNKLIRMSAKESPILYSEKLILRVSKKKMWRFIFDPGFSFLDMRKMLGEDCYSPLHFCSTNNWWLNNAYASKRRRSSYVLIKIRRVFSNLNWQEQEERMDGSSFRASSSLALSAAISMFLLRDNRLPLLDHWGTENDNKKLRCAVALRKRGCIFLYNRDIGCPDSRLGACLVKEFDKTLVV